MLRQIMRDGPKINFSNSLKESRKYGFRNCSCAPALRSKNGLTPWRDRGIFLQVINLELISIVNRIPSGGFVLLVTLEFC